MKIKPWILCGFEINNGTERLAKISVSFGGHLLFELVVPPSDYLRVDFGRVYRVSDGDLRVKLLGQKITGFDQDGLTVTHDLSRRVVLNYSKSGRLGVKISPRSRPAKSIDRRML